MGVRSGGGFEAQEHQKYISVRTLCGKLSPFIQFSDPAHS